MADKLNLSDPSDYDTEEVVNYLKHLSGLRGKFDHLSKPRQKEVMIVGITNVATVEAAL